jgi:uncharacterized protein (UPF0548 family)
MFLIGFPSDHRLQTLLADAAAAMPSYREVGGTAQSELPAGYRHDSYDAYLGDGTHTFDQAAAALRGWKMHAEAGLHVFPESASVALDITVLVVVRIGLLTTVAPCRVIYIVDEPDRFGFAYGTLPGHPERGEEAFVVHHSESGTRFTVRAFSRPQDPIARLGGPITRAIQKRATVAYLNAMKILTDEPPAPT